MLSTNFKAARMGGAAMRDEDRIRASWTLLFPAFARAGVLESRGNVDFMHGG